LKVGRAARGEIGNKIGDVIRANSPDRDSRLPMKTTYYAVLYAATLSAQSAVAADADNGRLLAQQHCSQCHIVEPGSRRELANSPPFDAIARKFSDAPESIAFAILSPHPRMNLAPSRRDAQDIAAYIATLAK
jgi:mono/diheme cytochrome c family protein